jgi:hypothetical protein
MKEYNVVFHYSVRVEADDEDDARDKAWSEFGEANPSSGDNFACTVEAIEDVWDTNEDGNHICVDCESEVDPDETFGNREFSEPRCEDCYDTHRYRS